MAGIPDEDKQKALNFGIHDVNKGIIEAAQESSVYLTPFYENDIKEIEGIKPANETLVAEMAEGKNFPGTGVLVYINNKDERVEVPVVWKRYSKEQSAPLNKIQNEINTYKKLDEEGQNIPHLQLIAAFEYNGEPVMLTKAEPRLRPMSSIIGEPFKDPSLTKEQKLSAFQRDLSMAALARYRLYCLGISVNDPSLKNVCEDWYDGSVMALDFEYTYIENDNRGITVDSAYNQTRELLENAHYWLARMKLTPAKTGISIEELNKVITRILGNFQLLLPEQRINPTTGILTRLEYGWTEEDEKVARHVLSIGLPPEFSLEKPTNSGRRRIDRTINDE
jgi:hypothetical protein